MTSSRPLDAMVRLLEALDRSRTAVLASPGDSGDPWAVLRRWRTRSALAAQSLALVEDGFDAERVLPGVLEALFEQQDVAIQAAVDGHLMRPLFFGCGPVPLHVLLSSAPPSERYTAAAVAAAGLAGTSGWGGWESTSNGVRQVGGRTLELDRRLAWRVVRDEAAAERLGTVTLAPTPTGPAPAGRWLVLEGTGPRWLDHPGGPAKSPVVWLVLEHGVTG